MVKNKEYKIIKHGRGITITLPKTWADDNGLTCEDKIEMYRDLEDRLIIVPKNRRVPNDQAKELREQMREQV